MHEAQMHEENCFITLTYNDEHIPDGGTLDYRDFQKFMKRLRKEFCYHLPSKKHHGPYRKVRYFVCGEYGERKQRPHYHAALFGVDFNDRVPFKVTPAGSTIFTSKRLEALWSDRKGVPLGHSSLGILNFSSAAYIARYVVKKALGRGSEKNYQFIDPETGEVNDLDKEFVRMSLRNGIGHDWYRKYKEDLFTQDTAIMEGRKNKVPKYYVKKLKEQEVERYEDLIYKRETEAKKYAEDNTENRLRQKEIVLAARVKMLKRDNI